MKYLIFTATAGNGHNSAARRISERLKERNADAQVKVVDAFKEYAGKFNEWIINDAYKFVCDRVVAPYNLFFKIREKIDYRANNRNGAVMQGYSVMAGMLKDIREYQPDVIFSTYEFCSVALSNLRRAYRIPAKIFSVTLDYGVSPYWERCSFGLDGLFLTSDDMAEAFIKKGFAAEKLVVTGIPVAKDFAHDRCKIKSREAAGLSLDKFTVLVAKASFFPVSDGEIARQIAKFDDVQTVIINGDEKRRLKMQRVINRAGCKNVVNLGYASDMATYFAAADVVVCKGGGLTVTETVNAGLPALIVKGLPQQEKYNKDALVRAGCAEETSGKDLARAVNSLKTDDKRLAEMAAATAKLRRADAIDVICNNLERGGVADYTAANLSDDDKTVVKKVKKAVKASIKEYKKIKADV